MRKFDKTNLKNTIKTIPLPRLSTTPPCPPDTCGKVKTRPGFPIHTCLVTSIGRRGYCSPSCEIYHCYLIVLPESHQTCPRTATGHDLFERIEHGKVHQRVVDALVQKHLREHIPPPDRILQLLPDEREGRFSKVGHPTALVS